MIVFDSCSIYIRSQKTLLAKIQAIDAVIAALEDSALNMAGNDSIQEYSLNDGQTIIKTIYKGAIAIGNAIQVFEKIRQRYINEMQGSMVRLVDGKNFNRRFNWNGRL